MSYRALRFGLVLFAGLLVTGASNSAAVDGAPRTATQDANRDADFVKGAIDSGQKAIDAGKVAIARATVPEVRAFAGRVVEDRTTANAELMSLAQIPPTPASAETKAAEAAGLDVQQDGLAFDRAYIAQAVTDHEAAVLLYEREVADGKDERLKLWAGQKLPVLRQHLETARSLGTKLAASAVR